MRKINFMNEYNLSCKESHNLEEKSIRHKHTKSNLQSLYNCNRIIVNQIQNKKKIKKNNNMCVEFPIFLAKKKVNEVISVLKSIENTNTSRSLIKTEESDNKLKYNKQNINNDSRKANYTDNDINIKNKSIFPIVENSLKKKMGLDFYNKVKVQILLTKLKNNNSLKTYQSLLTKQKKNNINIFPSIIKPKIELQTLEDDIYAIKNIKEYKEKFKIKPNDEFYKDFKNKRREKANFLIKKSHDLIEIHGNENLQFENFNKKISQRNFQSVDDLLEDYENNFETVKSNLISTAKTKELKHFKSKSINYKNKEELKIIINSENNNEIQNIQKDCIDLKKKTKFFKKKVRKESLEIKKAYGFLTKEIINYL